MKCSFCQSDIPEGQDFCPECGESIHVALVISKEVSKVKAEPKEKEQPKNLGNLLKTDKVALLGFLGGLLIIVSPFFTWIGQKYIDTRTDASLFSNTKEMGFDSVQMSMYGVAIVVLGVALLALVCGGFIPAVSKYTNSPIWNKILLVFGVLLLVAIFKNKEFSGTYNTIIGEVNKLKEAKVENPVFSGGLGAGPYLMTAGILFYGIYAFRDIPALITKRSGK